MLHARYGLAPPKKCPGLGRSPVEEVRDMRESFVLSPAVRFGT